MSGPKALWRICGALVLAAAFVGIAALIAWPEPPTQSLVPADGWEVEGGFVALDPPGKDLRESAVADPQTRYWRSWSPEHGSQPGTVRSKPFLATGPFAVPYNGFAGEPGVHAFVECVDTGERAYLATSRNNTQWSEVWIKRPSELCSGHLRVVATSTSTKDYIAIGTPYQLSRLSLLKNSTLTGFWFLALAGCVVAGWFAIFIGLARRWTTGVSPTLLAVAGVGMIGYVQFFVFWYQPLIGSIASSLLVLVGIYASARVLLGRERPEQGVHAGQLRFGLILWLAVAFAYFALSTVVDSGAGAWEVNGRFTPARWSTDNQLPSFVSRILVSGKHDDLGDFGPWAIGDRPPLSYGWHATLHSVFKWIGAANDGATLLPRYQLAIGTVLNTFWVAFLALMLPGLGLTRRRTLIAILVLSLCPVFIFNSVYVWPKLLSGTLALAGAWILLGLGQHQGRLRDDTPGLVAAAVLSALALLTHGGSAFGILVALFFAAALRGLPSLRGAAVAAAAALALLLPWSAWQATNHASGNALVKFAFAGTFGFGEQDISVLDTIVRSYRDLGMESWLTSKRDGLLTILFGIRNSCGLNEMGQPHSLIDRFRASDFYNIFPSLNFLVLGFVAIGIAQARSHAQSIAWTASMRLAAFGVASVAMTWLLTWDCFINHHQSYQALIALHVGLVLALLMSGRWGAIALLCSVLYGLVVWVVEPLNHFPRFDPVSAIVLSGMVILAIHAVRHSRVADMEQPL